MKRNLSQEYPAIGVNFRTLKGKIEKVELTYRPEGFAYEVNGDGSCEKSIGQWIEEYLNKTNPVTILPVNLSTLTAFTRSVYQTLISTPFGSTLTYKEVAEEVGIPKGARAVGNACGSNPFPLIIPCHRVLAAGSKLGGFSCGLEIKQELLKFEGIEVR